MPALSRHLGFITQKRDRGSLSAMTTIFEMGPYSYSLIRRVVLTIQKVSSLKPKHMMLYKANSLVKIY